MSKAAPKRSDYPAGLMGQAKYDAALRRYKASYGPQPTSSTKRPNRHERRTGRRSKPQLTIEMPAESKPAASKPAASKPSSGGGGGASGSSKPKPKSEYEQARSKLTVKSSKADRDAVRDKGMMAWANAHKGKQDAVGKKARAYLAEQERKKKLQNKATSNQGISARNNAARASRNIA